MNRRWRCCHLPLTPNCLSRSVVPESKSMHYRERWIPWFQRGAYLGCSGRYQCRHWDALQQLAVAMPITVEAWFPMSSCGEVHVVVFLNFIGRIGNDDDVICWSSLIPALEGEYLLVLIKMIDLCELSAESTNATNLIKQ